MRINSDCCFAVVNKDNDEYFYGLNLWGKEIRKAKFYHSLIHAQNVIEKNKHLNLELVEISIFISCI